MLPFYLKTTIDCVRIFGGKHLLIVYFQAELYNLDLHEWTIDKASDQRMVYVPKDTVIDFMKKVRVELGNYLIYPGQVNLYFGANKLLCGI